MKIFLSYASEDRSTATSIRLALAAQGHEVFFDRDDLPAGEEFDARIRRAIERSDLFLFLVSPQALDAGSYTLTELAIAERTWRHPGGKILPVVLRSTPLESIPPVLKSVTLLEPQGNVAGSVADAVYRIDKVRKRARMRNLALALGVAGAAALGAAFFISRGGSSLESTGRDGASAVLIPAGTFTMGDDEESPRREIHVDAFYIDRHEVTAARYAKFLRATGSIRPPEDWETLDLSKDGDLPVIGVDWNDADGYCRWAGRRLPTEAEWEKAARGSDARRFPWGETPPSASEATFGGAAANVYRGGLRNVGSKPAGRSPFGVDDLAGNAAEWVADWYSRGFARGDVRNPKGPERGEGKVIRGGGWQDPPERLTATKRFYASPNTRSEDTGFRCARDAAS